MIKRYFQWLHKDVPTGEVEKFPEIDVAGETSVKGIYAVGDLTGIPLLKLAAENGGEMIRRFNRDKLLAEKRKNKERDTLDFVIVGAGPAGIAAGLEAQKYDYDFKILEASNVFCTIANFPKGKPIYAEPDHFEQKSDLKIGEGTKETLLDDLYNQMKDKNLPLLEGVNVGHITKKKNQKGGYFEIITENRSGESKLYKALRVILATGKSGNARMLNVPGEDLEKVFNRLIDPQETRGHDVLVVGGGDSAVETAIAAAEFAQSVTLSYRKKILSRPKQKNIDALNRLAEQGKIKRLMETEVKEISGDSVILTDKNKMEIRIENSMVFVMIGKQLHMDFLSRINLKIAGIRTPIDKWMFFALLAFSGMVYFGKAGVSAALGINAGQASWGEVFSHLSEPGFWWKLLTYPFRGGFFETSGPWYWPDAFNGLIGYICMLAFFVSGSVVLVHFFRSIKNYTATGWKTVKYFYFFMAAVFFTAVYVGYTYFGKTFAGKYPGFWYTFLYSLTILIFGLRRIHVKPTVYIKRQTWMLILVQVFPLFLLPEIILPVMNKAGMLGGSDGFFLTQVFPGGDFSHAYRLILTWPLNIYGLFTDNLTAFWLIYTVLFTFGLIPYLVYRWGKGAYCGWICSCGALAETLGDEYRTLAPHGPRAKKWEHVGQWILFFIALITLLKLAGVLAGLKIPFIHHPRPGFLDMSRQVYFIVVDVVFAGVLGLGVYFFMSGRIWCRFFCPLAALMHIYARFTRYRIFSQKKKCISCNICTKVCHMGIDVMNYANKGIPVNDVECVRCSACVVNCPMDVLYFGSLPKKDVSNCLYKENPERLPKFDKTSWQQGLE